MLSQSLSRSPDVYKRQTIDWNPDLTSPRVIAEAVKGAGYEMIVSESEEQAVKEKEEHEEAAYKEMKRKVILAWVITVPLSVLCMSHIHFAAEAWIYMSLTLVVMLYCGNGFYLRGLKALRAKSPTMNVKSRRAWRLRDTKPSTTGSTTI